MKRQAQPPALKPKPISRRTHVALFRDIFEARHDLAGLAESHRLPPEALAAWIERDANRAVLQGLCTLADLQTQLMLSRFRQLAVNELIRQATGGTPAQGDDEPGQPVSPEQARKACVDLLRADLKTTGTARASRSAACGDDVSDEGDTELDTLAELRRALFGGEGVASERNEPASADEDDDAIDGADA